MPLSVSTGPNNEKVQRRKEAQQGSKEVLSQAALQKDGGQELHQPLCGHLK